MANPEADVTGLLIDFSDGRREALDELMPIVYSELQRIARAQLRGERPGRTLETAGLINEAYLRLIDQRRAKWRNRNQFFAICARFMRRILIDDARRRRSIKRGGDLREVTYETTIVVDDGMEVDVFDLHRALEKLQRIDPELAELVELRYYGGLTIQEAADALKVSPATVKRSWTTAKAWLARELVGDEGDS